MNIKIPEVFIYMDFPDLFLLAVGLSMDAFAVAACAGLTMADANLKKALTVGLYFGIFQAGMPLIGYFAAGLFAAKIIIYGHWIAFALLGFLGGKMIAGSFKKETGPDGEQPLSPAKMIPLALATSIDALAAGVSFAFIRVSIIPAVLFIGAATLVISAAGVKIGNMFGTKLRLKAQFTGGVILILIGSKILFEQLNTGVFLWNH